MTQRIATFILIATILIFLINFLFGWMNANVDSYFYLAIGEYFRTGQYPFTHPFIYTKPTTISPPLYGLFFILTHNLIRADVLLHFIQLGLLAVTSYLLYQILALIVKKPIAQIISCLFVIFPVNLIYASYVLTENASQFFVMLWVFLVIKGLITKKPLPIAIAVLVGSVAGLMKYSLMIYMVLAGVYLLRYIKKMKIIDYLFPLLALFVLGGWVITNYQITGVWGLYDTKGTQLYNQFVGQTKIIPPENHPAVIRIRSLLSDETDIRVPYWVIQEQLVRKLGGVWADVDKVLFDVAWASVSMHPVEYTFHSISNFARMHYAGNPHWKNLSNVVPIDLPNPDRTYCSLLDQVKMCTPIIMTPWSFPAWNSFISIELMLFRIFAPFVFFLLFLPSLIVSLLSKNILARDLAIMYLVGVIPIALTIHVDPRYIVPFYPLATLVIVAALQYTSNVVRNIGNRNKVYKRNEKK